MSQWLHLVMDRGVRRRAMLYAAVVGAILIAINHGDALLRGDIDETRILKMGLTIIIPYVVSTLSSVGAMRNGGGDDANPS